MINIEDFFKSLRLSWVRRYAFGNEKPLDDHWCDLLDMILDVEPHKRMSIINRGADFLTPKVLKYYNTKKNGSPHQNLVTIDGSSNQFSITLTSISKS